MSGYDEGYTFPPNDDLQVPEEEEGNEEVKPQDVDFYAVLNVAKEATEDEIKEAYKRLCRTFHPDKHVDQADKLAAETKFQVIQKAYEVLVDKTKRAIYDMFGEEGLRTSWDVGMKLKTPQELREEFERQMRERREKDLDNLVKSRGDIHINIDASQVFSPNNRAYRRNQRLPAYPSRSSNNIFDNFELKQLFLKHSFEVPVDPQTQVSIIGQMVTRNGIGSGNIVGSLRHTFSPTFWAEIGSSFIQPRMLTAKAFYNIDHDSLTTQSYAVSSPPMIAVTAGRRIGARTTGYLTYKTGAWSLGPWGRYNDSMFARREKSAVAIGLSRGGEKSALGLELQTGIIQSHISANYTRSIFSDYQLRTSIILSTVAGLTAMIAGDRKITANTKAGISIEFGYPNGIMYRLRVSRLGQRVTIPFIISPDLDLKLVFWLTAIPLATTIILDQAILKPQRKKKRADKLAAIREYHAELISTRKREAEESQRLLRPTVERKIASEREKDGLIIVEALYGNLRKLNDGITTEGGEVFDVTVAVQALVHDSQLVIPGGRSKSSIMGFYDPCLGEKKQLRIKYLFKRKEHEVIMDDTAPVACPLRSHIISDT
ncbi:2826_t:CDS:10 [Paraglomus occultum]|uniref:2826_t:CDS:1 n=1 Tax=Paraglomus occultum TaxID=144539 RepID=A0A9N8VVC0_9GLOM|nr:2826_t:CDS:10 [Paraglomus occultum]